MAKKYKEKNKNYSFEGNLQRRAKAIQSFKAKVKEERSQFEIIADSLTRWFGTITFLVMNLILFALWLTINLNVIPGIVAFDPYPFGMLTMIVSLEAIVLSIIVLISQNRESVVNNLREEMDMNVDVIAEEEITKLLELVSRIAEKNGINLSKDTVLQGMLKPVDKKRLEEKLREEMAEEL
jgi:uncharacterized membrane protein